MTFFFSLLDVVLTSLMLFDTLGIIYQFRKSTVDPKEYVRICYSWIFFLTICTLFSCNWKGFFGTLIRLLILAAKVYVTIPILGGTNKIHNYLIEQGKGEECLNKGIGFLKSKWKSGFLKKIFRINLPYNYIFDVQLLQQFLQGLQH